jgi:hypothetical protein
MRETKKKEKEKRETRDKSLLLSSKAMSRVYGVLFRDLEKVGHFALSNGVSPPEYDIFTHPHHH